MNKRVVALFALALLTGCSKPPAETGSAGTETKPVVANAAGLVPLPCGSEGAIRPAHKIYCISQRHYVTPAARAALSDVALALAAASPGTQVGYMEASWPIGKKPMPPHLSHGDGRQIDLALFYETPTGAPLSVPPATTLKIGYGAYEPPRRETERACPGGARGKEERPDPPNNRQWRLDEARTRQLVRLLVEDKRVRRVFIEPHLKTRLGFGSNAKVRFAGCRAARHDDHLHVDFY